MNLSHSARIPFHEEVVCMEVVQGSRAGHVDMYPRLVAITETGKVFERILGVDLEDEEWREISIPRVRRPSDV